jgi:hypothetical protein
MAKALPALDVPPQEDRARRALGWGAAILMLGLALVGVGQADAGTLPVLLGLAATIGAIHVYGRLGPPETFGHDGGDPQTPGAAPEARRRKAKVEKRRRMDKSPPP